MLRHEFALAEEMRRAGRISFVSIDVRNGENEVQNRTQYFLTKALVKQPLIIFSVSQLKTQSHIPV